MRAFRHDAASLLAEHRRKWSGVEDDPDRCDLVALYMMPLRDECRARRALRDHVIQHTDVVPVDEHFLHVDSLDDVVELLDRLEIRVRPVERVDRPLEGETVVQQLPSGRVVALPERLLESLYHCGGVGHGGDLLVAMMTRHPGCSPSMRAHAADRHGPPVHFFMQIVQPRVRELTTWRASSITLGHEEPGRIATTRRAERRAPGRPLPARDFLSIRADGALGVFGVGA